MSDAADPERIGEPSVDDADWTVELGTIEPAGSRQLGRRSAVALLPERLIVGTADGVVRAHDRSTGERRWRRSLGDGSDSPPSIVALEPLDGDVAVGTRGRRGTIAVLDGEDGTERWRIDAVADRLGPPQRTARFFLPFVASLATADGRLFAAARRYERGTDGQRRFASVVYAVDPPDGSESDADSRRETDDPAVAWRYVADASPIALSTDGDRVAIAFNRCPGDHDDGLVVLDAAYGSERWRWDPGTGGQRRVGDVALDEDAVFVASHGDYCGYRLDGGDTTWRRELATPVTLDGEGHYAYPNHVHAGPSGVVFVTGNTYAAESRETDRRHPEEHTGVGVSRDGEERFRTDVGGFASCIGADGDRLAVPAAQHFRERTPDAHGLLVLHCERGRVGAAPTDGVATAAAVDGDAVAAVEEPVVYHDEGRERGAYRAHVFS